jgi:hypothetical protein
MYVYFKAIVCRNNVPMQTDSLHHKASNPISGVPAGATGLVLVIADTSYLLAMDSIPVGSRSESLPRTGVRLVLRRRPRPRGLARDAADLKHVPPRSTINNANITLFALALRGGGSV